MTARESPAVIAAGAAAAAAAGYGLFRLFRWRQNRVVALAAARDKLTPGAQCIQVDTPGDYTPADNKKAAQCIADAFFADPLSRHLMPDDAFYRSETPFLNGIMLWALHASYGMCDVSRTAAGGVVVVALWEPASMTFAGGLRFLWLFVKMLTRVHRFGFRTMKELGHLMSALEAKRHKHAPTAYHLQVLGTQPEHQSRGLGGKVIEAGIARATAAGVPAYLESSNPKNVPFYRRHGFEVVEEYYPFPSAPNKGPLVTLMFRPLNAKSR